MQAKVAGAFSLLALWSDLWVLMAVTFTFILIDFYYGYQLSRKVKRDNPSAKLSGKLESRRWWHTIVKLKDATLFIFMAYLADRYIIPFEKNYFACVVAGFIAGAEFWSMLENKAYLSDAKWATWLRKYVRNKAEKHLNINLDDE